MFFPYSLFWVVVEFRTFRGAWWSFAPSVCVVAGMAHSVFLRKI